MSASGLHRYLGIHWSVGWDGKCSETSSIDQGGWVRWKEKPPWVESLWRYQDILPGRHHYLHSPQISIINSLNFRTDLTILLIFTINVLQEKSGALEICSKVQRYQLILRLSLNNVVPRPLIEGKSRGIHSSVIIKGPFGEIAKAWVWDSTKMLIFRSGYIW